MNWVTQKSAYGHPQACIYAYLNLYQLNNIHTSINCISSVYNTYTVRVVFFICRNVRSREGSVNDSIRLNILKN